MAFIPNPQANKSIDKTVRLIKDVQVLKGVFTKGHTMKIIGTGVRGYDLVDDNGNLLLETGSSNFEIVE